MEAAKKEKKKKSKQLCLQITQRESKLPQLCSRRERRSRQYLLFHLDVTSTRAEHGRGSALTDSKTKRRTSDTSGRETLEGWGGSIASR